MKRVTNSVCCMGAILLAALFMTWSLPLPAAAASPDRRAAAYALEQQGKNAEAEAAWRSVLRLQPADAEAWAHLGFLQARQEHYKDAVVSYRRAAALNPAIPGLQLNLGLALFKAAELKQAIHVFLPLSQQEPPDSENAQRLRILLGMAHYGLGEYAAAVPYLKDATARDPQNLPYRLVLANSCLRSQQYPCVLDVYREILTLNAESAEADMLAGEALDAMRDHSGATQQFRAAVKADPRNPDAHFGLGYLLWCQSQYEEAAQEFQTEVDLVPRNSAALTFLGDSLRQLSHPDLAKPLFDQALRIDPRNTMAHLDLGILAADAGQNEVALREFKTAARLGPGEVQVHWRLARLYLAMGRKQEARAEFDLTKSLNKAADDTVFTKLNSSRADSQPDPAATAPPR